MRPVRRDPARQGHDLDDDQRAGGDHPCLLRGRRRAGGHPRRAPRRHDPDRHLQGVHRPEGVVLPDRPGDAPGHRHGRVVRRARCPAGTRSRSPDTTSARRARPRSRSSRSRSRMASPTSSRRSSGVWTWTRSRPGCRSSSTPISTSSRRSPSTAPRAGSGRARCATPTARKRPESLRMRFHTQTAGVSLTAQQPLQHRPHRDRGARRRSRRHPVAAHELLRRSVGAAHRGGGRIALRTQQVIAHETGVTNTVDPLGGSYFVERLTDEMERGT